MVLKKQTVWLITMLSLLIVLSVYYMLPGDDQAAMSDLEDDQKKKNVQMKKKVTMLKVEISSYLSYQQVIISKPSDSKRKMLEVK